MNRLKGLKTDSKDSKLPKKNTNWADLTLTQFWTNLVFWLESKHSKTQTKPKFNTLKQESKMGILVLMNLKQTNKL